MPTLYTCRCCSEAMCDCQGHAIAPADPTTCTCCREVGCLCNAVALPPRWSS